MSTVVGRINTVFSQRQENPFNVYFAHGVYDSVRKELINKDGGITTKDQKYPLIWLVTPIQQVPHPRGTDAHCELPDLQWFILMPTREDATEDENIENCFEPFLRPIYDELLTQIERSCLFQVLSADAIPHEMKEWAYQKNTDGKANLFSDYINAIQIRRMRLLVHEPVVGTHILNP